MRRMRVSRREFLSVAGAAGGAAVLAACAPAPAGTDEGQAAAPAMEDVELQLAGWPGQGPELIEGLETFEEENPGIKATWLETPGDYRAKLLSMIAAGTPPDTAFSTDYYTFARDGLLIDITDMLMADPLLGAEDYFIQPQEEERCTWEGRWYGIGSCWVCHHIYYNRAIFEEEGIDPPSNDPDEIWTWDHFVDVARQMTVDANGNHPGDSGFDIENVERWGMNIPYWMHWSFVLSNGGYVWHPETRLYGYDQPEAIEAVQKVADLVLVDQVMPNSATFEAIGMGFVQLLETRTMAMVIEGSWSMAYTHDMQEPLGTAVLPKMKVPATWLSAHLHTIMQGTKHVDESWKLVRFLSSPYYQELFLVSGLWLPSQTALITEEAMDRWMSLEVHREGYRDIATKWVPDYGHPMYGPPGEGEASGFIWPALDAVWIGDKTAEEALLEATPKANEVLENA